MSIFTPFSERVVALTGWRALAACFVSGAVMALGFAPFHLWPVILVCLPVFYVLLYASPSVKVAAERGFFFGYGYFMAGTWWIANALMVDVAKFGWMIPFSVLGLSAVLALWFLLFGVLVYRLRKACPLKASVAASSVPNVLRFAALWVVVEYLRSLGMFGFPWNLVGYMSLASLPVAQLASVIGTYGLGFLVVLVGLSPVLVARNRWMALMPVVIIAGAYGYGVIRIPPKFVMTQTRIRVVQGAIPQSLKWSPEGSMESLRVYAALMSRPAPAAPDVAVWPETAFPFTLRDGDGWPERLAKLLPNYGVLLTGAVRAEGHGADFKIWNSLVAIDAQGRVQDWYGKHQLVPFGEFVPLRDVLPLDKITPGDTDFSRGVGARTVTVEHVPPFSPLICYEAIFPSLAVNAQQRPAWLVNITNDAWYGDSPGPYQHLDMARMRAIEQGLPLVRAANTGISAVVDPYGRMVAVQPLGVRGVLDVLLPAPLSPTFYSRV